MEVCKQCVLGCGRQFWSLVSCRSTASRLFTRHRGSCTLKILEKSSTSAVSLRSAPKVTSIEFNSSTIHCQIVGFASQNSQLLQCYHPCIKTAIFRANFVSYNYMCKLPLLLDAPTYADLSYIESFLAESPFHSSMCWVELNVSAFREAPCGHEVLAAVTAALDRSIWSTCG